MGGSSIPFKGCFSVVKKEIHVTSKTSFFQRLFKYPVSVVLWHFEITETLIVCENITEIYVLVKYLNHTDAVQ